jgi:hypothetical protein
MITLDDRPSAATVPTYPITTRVALVVAGLLLAAYPLSRPWADTSPGGAPEAFASPWWPIAHTAAVLGFIALALALRAWPASGDPSPLRDPRRAESRAWIAVALLGPYYGGEAYVLHEIGRRAQDVGDPSLVDLADQFRYAAIPLTIFALGLLALALVGGRLIALTRDRGRVARVAGILAGLGLLTYLPQFFLPPVGRIAHGLLLGAGLLLLGVSHVHPSNSPAGAPQPRLGS